MASDETTTPTTGVLARPQPLGVFPLPAGYLLVPADPACDGARLDLVAGRRPASFPPALAFYQAALDGDLDGALGLVTGDDPVSRANRLVLEPTPGRLRDLQTDAAAQGDIDLAAFAAVIGFVVGLLPTPPDEPAAGDAGSGFTGEVAALVLAARATQSLERGDRAAAIDQLEVAAQAAWPVSTALAGQLMGQLANLRLDEGDSEKAAVTFDAALDALAGTDLVVSRAELHVAAGAMYQERAEAAPRLLQQAVNHYHQAMALVDAVTAPETFAVANANLGLAYLMMPMQQATDQLRMGVAVQSMREALTYFTPEHHPDRWASTQLNLANALVYLPSKHQADNIAEAVGLYQEVLERRDPARDPLGRARVLANQGNALAHLGHFDDAESRLGEARDLFAASGDLDAARTVAGLLTEVTAHRASLTGGA